MLYVDNLIMNSNSVKDKAPRGSFMDHAIKDSGEESSKVEGLSRRDSRVRALENSINFLKSQQDSMLKGLHKEIETLRRTNKACGCETRENELKNEIKSLTELLEDEKRQNTALLEQIKAMQLNQTLASSRRETEEAEELVADSPKEDRLREPAKESDVSGNSGLEKMKSNDKPEHRRINTTPRGHSSSRTRQRRNSLNAPDGVWVKPTSKELSQSSSIPSDQISPAKGLTGTRLLPTKLPAIKTQNNLSHVVVTEPTKSSRPSDVLKHASTTSSSNSCGIENILHARLASESNLLRESHSARSAMGHNSIAVFDPVVELPVNSRSLEIRRGKQTYANGIRPFLPALPKSQDINGDRQRKTRNLQCKRLDRAHNLYPS